MLTIYISGPISNGGRLPEAVQFANARVAMATADELFKLEMAPCVPHLFLYMNEFYPQTWQTYVDAGLSLLSGCDAVLRLPGESRGADIECLRAVDLRIPVYTSMAALKTALVDTDPLKNTKKENGQA